ncbi:MAG: hypothetical protein AAB515_03120 [Patescibacteria group bacterium]
MAQDFLNHEAVKKLTEKVFQDVRTEIVDRPHSYIVKAKDEGKTLVSRMIVLLPHGYTANDIHELSSHDEVRKAKVLVIGALREGKKNPSLLKNCLTFSYLVSREAVTEESVPYARIVSNKNIHKQKVLSSKETLFIVKENGEGFYHNLINTTNEPILLLLTKELKSGKPMDIVKRTTELSLGISEKTLVFDFIKRVQKNGDRLFTMDSHLIKNFLNLEMRKSLPILVEALNIHETGKHEPCTIFALILKKARSNKSAALQYLLAAIKNDAAPQYYLNELVKKLNSSHMP